MARKSYKKNQSNNSANRGNVNNNKSVRGNNINSINPTLKDSSAIARRKQLNTYFNFDIPVGARFDVSPQKNVYGTPGIMTMYFTPSFGFNNDANTEIQNALDNFYREIRRFQTADASYTSTDLMLYVLAAEQIYSWITYLSRGYNLICSSAYQNKYAGRALAIASGFDYDSLKSQTSSMLDIIDEAVNTMASFALPPQLEFVKRQQYILANVFTDAVDDQQAQLYMFNPRTFFQLVEHRDSENVVTWALEEISNPHVNSDSVYNSKGLVSVRNLPTGSATTLCYDRTEVYPIRLTLDNIQAVTDTLLNAFRNQRFNFDDMNGDIYRVYGATALRSWTPITVGRAWFPIHDEAIEMMIENATLVGHLDSTYTKLTENSTGEILISNPCLAIGDFANYGTNPAWTLEDTDTSNKYSRYKVMNGDRVLNFHKDQPTPEDMLWATRMCNIVDKGTALLYPEDARLRILSAGTEILEFALIWVFDYANSQSYNSIIAYSNPLYYSYGPKWFLYRSTQTVNFGDDTSLDQYVNALNPIENAEGFLHAFKHHPIIAKQTTFHKWTSKTEHELLRASQISYIAELGNWTVLSPEQLIKLTNVDLSEAFISR